jgi:uncharacterized protein with NRDE domain
MPVVRLLGYKTFWMRKHKTLKAEFQDLMSKHPDTEAQLWQLFGVLCDTEEVAGYTPPTVGESDKWTEIMNTVEENQVTF